MLTVTATAAVAAPGPVDHKLISDGDEDQQNVIRWHRFALGDCHTINEESV